MKLQTNRLLAFLFFVIWLVPASALLKMPHERSIELVNSLPKLVEDSKRANIPLPPTIVGVISHAQSKDNPNTLDPDYFEPTARTFWLLELAMVAVGTTGIVCLWWKPRYVWRVSILLSVTLFIYASGLSHLQSDLVECGYSFGNISHAITSYAMSLSTFITHLVGPPVLLLCSCYALFSRNRGTNK